MGALLSGVLDCGCPVEDITEGKLREIIRFANVAGALCTAGRGAIAAMPSREQVLERLKSE